MNGNDNRDEILKTPGETGRPASVSHQEGMVPQEHPDTSIPREAPENSPSSNQPASPKNGPVPNQPEGRISKSTDWIVRPLRTYKSDLAEAIKRNRASLVSMAAAESKRREEKPLKLPQQQSESAQHTSKVVFVSGALFLISLILVGIFAFVFKLQQTVTVAVDVPTLIFTDKQREIIVDNLGNNPRTLLVQEKEKVTVPSGGIEMLYFTEELPEGKSLVAATNFLPLLVPNISSRLIRSLDQEFNFGIHALNTNEPFLVLKVNSFEAAFASMLEWEPTMNKDLAPLFGPEIQIAATQNRLQPLVFVDRILKNKDIRALIDSNGEIRLLYGFLDKDTLVITTNTQTFDEIFARFTTSRVLK